MKLRKQKRNKSQGQFGQKPNLSNPYLAGTWKPGKNQRITLLALFSSTLFTIWTQAKPRQTRTGEREREISPGEIWREKL